MLSDAQLEQLACKEGWENCPCVPCQARREILWHRGHVDELQRYINILESQHDRETLKWCLSRRISDQAGTSHGADN